MRTIFGNIISEKNLEPKTNIEYIYNLDDVWLNHEMIPVQKHTIVENVHQENAKYEDGLYTNNIICPDKLYYLSYQKHKDSILKKGLYPKSKKRTSDHPERIYLFDDYNESENLLKALKFSDLKNNINESYILLEINCTTTKLILHSDPNYKIGYFTYDNINPINIKILNENL